MVVRHIDKATGNVTFICKRFYVEVPLKDVGVSTNEQTKFTETYNVYGLFDQGTINKHLQYIKNNFNVSLELKKEKT